MDAKRRQQQQQQQQQLCVQALHHQNIGNHCTHGAPLGYLPSPWVMWDAGMLTEISRKRKKKKRLCTACLLAGVAVAILAVAGVAGLAVYLGGTPPTDSSTKWESFRRAGEVRPGEEATTSRLHHRHGILLKAEPTERTTPPARSPWAIRREEGVRWEGRGGGSSTGDISREDNMDFPYEESEGIPEVEVVLEREGLEDQLAGGDNVADQTESQSARSPFARASEGRRPIAPPIAELPEVSRRPYPVTSAEVEHSTERTRDTEWFLTTPESHYSSTKDEKLKDEDEIVDSESKNEWQWGSPADDVSSIYGGFLEEMEDSEELDEEEEDEKGIMEESGDETKDEEKKGGGEERRQHHASSKVPMEGIPVFNMLTKILTRLNSSSMAKEMEVPPTNNGTISCSPGQIRCTAANEGIMCLPPTSRCDGVRDCTLTGEDETGCNCADSLRSRFLHRKLCDGVPDCWDYSDEDQCEWCSPGHLVCGGGARTCVEPKRICDGVKDCPDGEDESHCIALYSGDVEEKARIMEPEARKVYQGERSRNSNARGSDHVTASMITNRIMPYRSSGYLLVRKKGVWGKLCLDGSNVKEVIPRNDVHLKTWNVADIGNKVCKALTHRDFEIIEEVKDEENIEDTNSSKSFPPYYELPQISSNNNILESVQNLHTTECSSKKVVRIKCKELECGVRPKIRVNQWSRIVGGGNAAPGAWPWQAALYREGEFQCGATLISSSWLVSAGHCFFHARDDYWVARLGTLRRGTDLPSPHEQRRPVSSIVLHPSYVDAGFLNDIALLRLSSPIEITDHVRPACLPPGAMNIPTPIFQEKDIEPITQEDIPDAYDEGITTSSSVLNSYETMPTNTKTDLPFIDNQLNKLKGSAQIKVTSFWDSSGEESTKNETVVLKGNTTSIQPKFTDVEKQTTIAMEVINKEKLNEEQWKPIFPNIKFNEENPTMQVFANGAYTNLDNQDDNSPIFTVLLDSENRDENETKTTQFHMEDLNSDHDKISNYFNPELISFTTEPITDQNLNSDFITELHTKVLTSNKTFNDTGSLYVIKNEAVTTRSKIDKTINKTSHEFDLVKVPYNNSKDEYSKEKKLHPSHGIDDSKVLKSKIHDEMDISYKQMSHTTDITSLNTLGLETLHKHIKTFKKGQNFTSEFTTDGPNLGIKSSDGKIQNSTEEIKKRDQGNSTKFKTFLSSTESLLPEETTKETLTESIKSAIKHREARDADLDDGAEDGIKNGRLCTVVGWGQLFEVGRIFPDTLQEVELPLISTKECRKRTLYLPLYHLTDAMFCAGYDRGGRDACLGDSGGPLMCKESDGRWSLYGVTSNGYGCARANRPGVYTKVSHYIPWMEEVMMKEDAAQEVLQKEEKDDWKEAVGGAERWRQRWEWRKRQGDDHGVGGKHYCPHRCPLGECLQRARVCNGVVDCSDASDEQNCHDERDR